jgi:hypothetical protein
MIKTYIKVGYMLMELCFKIRMIITFDENSNTERVIHFKISWFSKKINILLWLEMLFVFVPPYLILKKFLPRYLFYFVHKPLGNVLVHSEN